jgi:hypothetical protein
MRGLSISVTLQGDRTLPKADIKAFLDAFGFYL